MRIHIHIHVLIATLTMRLPRYFQRVRELLDDGCRGAIGNSGLPKVNACQRGLELRTSMQWIPVSSPSGLHVASLRLAWNICQSKTDSRNIRP